MVESTCFQHTSSHPDKYNNSVDRIISKEEEREDPRRDSSIYLRIQCFHKNYSVSTRNPVIPCQETILHTELILLQEISKKYYNYKAHPMQINTRHLPATVSHASKHSTWQNKAPSSPTAFQAHTAQAGFQLILPGRNSILSGSQYPRSPYSSSQAHSYRILQGELGFFPKGLSIVCPCNTKVSVFQFTC